VRELIEKLPHDLGEADQENGHEPEKCLRCKLEREWERVTAMYERAVA
jgi:hypothetical protein